MEKNLHILIVADNLKQSEELAGLIKQEPSSAGYTVTIARDAPHACEIVKSRQSPHIIVVDMGADSAKGSAVVKTMNQAAPELPIIVITDQEDDAVVLQAMECGALDYLIRYKTNALLLARTVRHIIQRRRAEAALQKEQYLLKVLMDNISDLIYFKDAQSKFLRVNRAMAERNGLKDPAEMVGKSDSDLFVGEHAPQALADEQEIMKTGKPIVGKMEEEIWASGRHTWVSTTKMPLRDHDGKMIGTFGVSRDITQAKLAEEALGKERNLLRTLIDNIPDSIFVKDAESRFILANHAVAATMGTTPENLIGKTDFDFHPKDKAAQYYADEQRIMTSNQPMLDKEEQVVSKDGHTLWFSTTKVPLRDSRGKVIGLVGIGRDITARRQAEETVRESEVRFRQLFDDAPVGYHEINTEGLVVRVNKTELDMLGYTAEEMIGKPIWDFVEEDISHKALLAKLAGAIPAGRAFERTFRRKNGSLIPVLIEDRILRDKDGHIMGIRSTLEDITDRKRAEEELRLLSLTDPRTGLSNRRAFLALSTHQLKVANRTKRKMLMTYMDINGLKAINDEHGFQEGDKALAEAADVMRATFRNSDIVARIGEDDFVALAIETTSDAGKSVAERMDEVIKGLNAKPNRHYQLSVSVGSIEYDPAHPCSIDEILQRSRITMMADKETRKGAGGNRSDTLSV
ncbi:MAG: PAS domain S-box protein [Planctomycetes bacterium]|nr:PAS domain S-box protein [Planctomycetota bacterium]